MAKSNAVWGIDIGQCGLKALRCQPDPDGEGVIADAFDFIEYPKILTQPEAEPEALVKEALEQFLSRNELRGDKVAVSVSGQAGLSRFFKPPPVDSKRLPEIVKYEAKQQIPFNLEDVVWDYQQLGGTEVDGFVMDAEIGLFAMKRDAVFRALQPFLDADIEVDVVQLAPLSIFNSVLFELLTDVPEPEEIDPENPPESTVVMSMGTDTTDLVITNGIRLWQRSIPLGGNHFTRQLTKDLKLTFAKAEHLKRNARQAEDPKTVFQVMRPVFNDLVTEVQRSISYFQSIDRNAKISRMVMLGNATKLPGLRQYVSKNLGLDVAKFDKFEHLSGATVVSSPSFKENILSFGVCYGLCLQGLEQAKLLTNLLPTEFVTERLIREKKPWALASVGALLLGLTLNFYFYYNAWYRTVPTHKDSESGVTWKQVGGEVESVQRVSSGHIQTDNSQMQVLNQVRALGDEVIGDSDRKRLWLELLAGLNQALPTDPDEDDGRSKIFDPTKTNYDELQELQIDYLNSEYFEDVSKWFVKLSSVDRPQRWLDVRDYAERKDWKSFPEVDTSIEADPSADSFASSSSSDYPSSDYGDGYDTGSGQQEVGVGVGWGPKGPGWVIQIAGHHFYNTDEAIQNQQGGMLFVHDTLLSNIYQMKIDLPIDIDEKSLGYKVNVKKVLQDYYSKDGKDWRQEILGELRKPYTFDELGVKFALIPIEGQRLIPDKIPNPNHPLNISGGSGEFEAEASSTFGARPGSTPTKEEGDDEFDQPQFFDVIVCRFIVEFCWQPVGENERLQQRLTRLEQQVIDEQAQAEAGELDGGASSDNS